MEHLNKAQIGNLVRRQIHIQTRKSTRSMHLDTRIYSKDAAGVYPKTYSGKNLGLTADSMDRVLLEIESDLKIDLGLNGKWGDPRSFAGTPIVYNKDTRLHNLIDFVHDQYNKAIKNKKTDTEKTSSIVDNKNNINTYYIKVKKGDDTMYVSESATDDYVWTFDKALLTLFESSFIEDIFDLGDNNDVILTAKDCSLSHLLFAINPPFELSIVRVIELEEGNNWIYAEEETVERILTKLSREGNLSKEEAELIRSKLK